MKLQILMFLKKKKISETFDGSDEVLKKKENFIHKKKFIFFNLGPENLEKILKKIFLNKLKLILKKK